MKEDTIRVLASKHRAKGKGRKIVCGKQRCSGRSCGYSDLGGWNRCEGFESHKTSVGLKTKFTSLAINLQCFHTYRLFPQ